MANNLINENHCLIYQRWYFCVFWWLSINVI